MAKRSSSGKEKYNSKEEYRVENSDVYSAVAAFDKKTFEGGYPDTMDHHINRGVPKKERREGAAD